MKKYLILLAAMCLTHPMWSAGHALRLSLDSGSTATYVLSSKPVVTFSDGKMTVSNTSLEDSYSLGQIISMAFVEDITSLAPAVSEGPVYDFRGNVFRCEGNDIRVYDLSGRPVAGAYGEVSLQALENGVYIVSVAGRSIKVFKK